ncbi:Cut9-interacting protein scn1 [Leucoagaricus sp. SymC.cos]|nr:Cut9-interacting protein scn1 [Leucoagaricus sp. SymC.cos]
MTDLPPDEVLRHVVDVHCHPTDSFNEWTATVCAMASRNTDQVLVRDLASAYPSKVIPCFGYHPWFSHCIALDASLSKEEHYQKHFLETQKVITQEHRDAFNAILPSLPSPSPLSVILDQLRLNLSAFPNAMVGEVGTDRSFHVPFDFYERPRRKTPFNVPIDHQLAILEAQLDAAVKLGRNTSIHSVHLQQATADLLDRLAEKHGESFYCISFNLHSCGLSSETWRVIEKKHPNVYISLSTVVNGRSSGYKALIATCADDRILAESDYDSIDMSTSQTWDMVKTIAEIKEWKIETSWADDLEEKEWGVVHHLKRNWERFCAGNHTPPSTRKPAKHRKMTDRYKSPSPS